MTPTTVSAILQLDYPDRLPKGHRNAQPTAWMLWTCHGPPLSGSLLT